MPPGLPSPPQSPNTSTVQTGPNNITVLVQWSYPQNDGGAPVDNYTVTLVGPGAVHLSTNISVQPVATFTLALNEEYTVSIAATNCVGTGGTVSLNISQSEGEHIHCELPEAITALTGRIVLSNSDFRHVHALQCSRAREPTS